MKKSFIVALLLINILLPVNVSAETNDEITHRLDIIEQNINSIQKSLANLTLSQGNSGDWTKNFKDLSEEIKNLQSDIERLDLKVKKHSNQYDVLEASLTSKINSLSKGVNNSDLSSQSKDSYIVNNIAKEIEANNLFENDEGDTSKKDENQASAHYQKAYLLLKKDDKNHDKALEEFTKFVDKFHESPLRGNAYYWIGSIHSEQRNYGKAAVDFLNGYKANPKSGRAIDNLLGLSSSLVKLNKNKEACSSINKLYNEFPNMNITNKRHADEIFQNAGCTNND
jgi:tol-pal system protein YbgF